jgi:hypothetical protein
MGPNGRERISRGDSCQKEAEMLRRTPISLVLVAGVALLLPARAQAATYYIDCTLGNDGNNGTSPSTPWRSIGRAHQEVYRAGDSILLLRGCTWSEPGFQALGNGTVSAPITLADYGSGALPQIVGVGDHEAAVLLQNVQN